MQDSGFVLRVPPTARSAPAKSMRWRCPRLTSPPPRLERPDAATRTIAFHAPAASRRAIASTTPRSCRSPAPNEPIATEGVAGACPIRANGGRVVGQGAALLLAPARVL